MVRAVHEQHQLSSLQNFEGSTRGTSDSEEATRR